MSAMKFGIEFVPDKALGKIVELVVAAENGGFDYVWVTDHYNNRNVYVLLTDIALNTQRIRIGTGVTNPFHVNPVWTASAVASLDELSRNRMILGLGPGDLTTMKSLGIDFKKPLTAVRESVDIIRKLWSRETVKFDGEVFKVGGAKLNFKVEKPIPIYVGAQGPKMLELAGAIGDGVLINAAHPQDFEYARKQIEKGVTAAGRDLSKIDIVAYASCSVDYDLEKAKKKAREVVAFIVAGSPDEVLKRHGIPVEEKNRIMESLAKGDFGVFETVTDQMLGAFSICGTPGEVVEKISELLKVGVTQVVIGSPIGPKKGNSISLIAQEVIPKFT